MDQTRVPSKRVYFFGTCLIDVFYPEAGLDAIALLELAGFEVLYPQAQTCCGQPPYNSGFQEESIVIAAHTLELFEDPTLDLIVPSASCAGMIKFHYPKLFPANSPQQKKAEKLAERTYELIDFLVDKLPYEQLNHSPLSGPISLHESCMAQREMSVAPTWQKILNKMGIEDISIPPHREECCGFGGTFSVKSAAISAAMTEDKCAELMAANPDHIVSGDCGCLMNLGSHLEKNSQHNPCLHLASFIAQRFGIHHEA